MAVVCYVIISQLLVVSATPSNAHAPPCCVWLSRCFTAQTPPQTNHQCLRYAAAPGYRVQTGQVDWVSGGQVHLSIGVGGGSIQQHDL